MAATLLERELYQKARKRNGDAALKIGSNKRSGSESGESKPSANMLQAGYARDSD